MQENSFCCRNSPLRYSNLQREYFLVNKTSKRDKQNLAKKHRLLCWDFWTTCLEEEKTQPFKLSLKQISDGLYGSKNYASVQLLHYA